MFKALFRELFRDYHLVHVKTDARLLADVSNPFRTMCISYYELDPSNYLSSPGMAWDALL